MTPKERVNRFFKREPIDTMPCFSGMGMVTIQVINEMGIRFPEVHTSAEFVREHHLIEQSVDGVGRAIYWAADKVSPSSSSEDGSDDSSSR